MKTEILHASDLQTKIVLTLFTLSHCFETTET